MSMAESMSDSATTWMVYEICCACASGAAQSANSTASTALKAVRCEAVGRRCGFTLEVLPLEQYYRQRREQRSVECDEGHHPRHFRTWRGVRVQLRGEEEWFDGREYHQQLHEDQ